MINIDLFRGNIYFNERRLRMKKKKLFLVIMGMILILKTYDTSLSSFSRYLGYSSSQISFSIDSNKELVGLEDYLLNITDYQIEDIDIYIWRKTVYIKMPEMNMNEVRMLAGKITEEYKSRLTPNHYGYYVKSAFKINEMNPLEHFYYLYNIVLSVVGVILIIVNIKNMVRTQIKLKKYRSSQYEQFRKKNASISDR